MAQEILNVKKYLKRVNEIGLTASIIRKGRFYSYGYDFSKKEDYNKIKFWDVFPLVFVFENAGGTFFGLNFHHIPRQSRLIWLARIKKVLSERYDKDQPMTSMNYQRLFYMFKKSTFGIRQYKKDRVNNLKRIETPEQIEELMRIVANSYYGVNYPMVENQYKMFIPKSTL